jgi:FkbM family methyltransferase
MSRTIARLLHGLTDVATLGQTPSKRAATMARLIERLDLASAHTVETRHGPIKTLPLRGPHLAAAAIGFHEEEPETLGWIDAMPDGAVFYDVGAATGLFSMYAALRPALTVYAFEPKATSFGVLVEHLALNGMGERVFPMPVALSDETAAIRFTLSALAPQSGMNSVGGVADQFGKTHDAFVQGALAYRLDDLISTFQLPPPTHLKIDVDGIEGAILRGAPLALKGVQSVVLEVEGENAAEAATRIDPPLQAAGLVEDVSFRTKGSARNRHYVRI